MNRERSERGKNEKKWRFGHTKIIGPRPLGGARAGCAPPGSASVYVYRLVDIPWPCLFMYPHFSVMF